MNSLANLSASGHLFCFGYGYCAQTLGERLLAEGWQVSGTTRSAEKAEKLAQQGVNAMRWQDDETLPAATFQGVTHILSSVKPASAGGDPVLKQCATTLAEIPTLRWVGYFSTVGVYGDRDGEWVDESSPVRPSNVRGERRLQAERSWLAWGARHQQAVHIFRLPSIYGPGRNVLRKLKERRARRLAVPGQYFSRIHVTDIARVVQASLAQPRPGAVYNVCDDRPSSSRSLTEYGAELLGIEPPPLQTLAEAELSPMARSFYASSKRVRNDKIKQELGVTLAYPDYRVGLRDLFEKGAY